LLISSSSDVIIELSSDLKILEFSPEAEKYFGKNREDAINLNYIQLFVPEQAQKKSEKDLKKLMSELGGGKLKMRVTTTGGRISDVEYSATVLQNNLKIATGIILSLKR
jgi:PAS domain S-box-containing protein